MARRKPLLILGFGLTLSGCGGPKPHAKVALALQTLMASILEAYATKSSDETRITLACGDRSGNQGFLSYDPQSAIPQDPLELIYSASSAANVPLILDKCRIEVCGESFILESDGTHAQLDMGRVAELLDTVSNGQVPAKITLRASNLPVGGSFVSTAWTFSYSLQGVFDRTTLQELVVSDGSPASRLTVEGVEIKGDEINDLADGC